MSSRFVPMRALWLGLASLGVLGGCSPLEYCVPPECSLVHPDAAADLDAGVALDADVGPIDAADQDAGPPPIPPPLDGGTLPARVCSLGGWCWISPAAPVEGDWQDVAVIGGNAWIVSEHPIDGVTPGGAILRYDGMAWRGLIGRGARRVAGSADTDVWLLSGDRELTHFDGSAFVATPLAATLPPGRIRAIASSSATEAWAVGDAGLVLHWHGGAWGLPDAAHDPGAGIGDLNALYAAGTDDLWMAGAGGIVRHWASGHWTPMDAASSFDIAAIWALPTAMDTLPTAWIGGAMGARYVTPTATAWTAPTSAASNITAIAGADARHVYFVTSGVGDLRALDTSITAVVDGAPECERVAVAPFDGDILRVGRRSHAGSLACSIDRMSLVSPGLPGVSPIAWPLGHLSSIAVRVPTDTTTAPRLVAYGDTNAWLGDPTTMGFAAAPTLFPPTTSATGPFHVEAASGATELWITAGDGTLLHWAGSAWASVTAPGDATSRTFASDGVSTWLASHGDVYAWNGAIAPPAFEPRGNTLAADVSQLAVHGGVAWALFGGMLARLDAGASTWTSVPLDPSWPSDCAPLVAIDADTIECLADGGRYRLHTGTGGLVTMTSMGPTYTTGDARALAGPRGWIFSRGPAGEADERMLWATLEEGWNARSSGLAGGGTLAMLADGTTWRLIDGGLLYWSPTSP